MLVCWPCSLGSSVESHPARRALRVTTPWAYHPPPATLYRPGYKLKGKASQLSSAPEHVSILPGVPLQVATSGRWNLTNSWVLLSGWRPTWRPEPTLDDMPGRRCVDLEPRLACAHVLRVAFDVLLGPALFLSWVAASGIDTVSRCTTWYYTAGLVGNLGTIHTYLRAGNRSRYEARLPSADSHTAGACKW